MHHELCGTGRTSAGYKPCKDCQDKQNRYWQLLPDLDTLDKRVAVSYNRNAALLSSKTFSHKQDHQDISGFFRLPVEIRQTVYRHVLTSARPLRMTYNVYPQHPTRLYTSFIRTGYDTIFDHGLTPALLQTCQRIRHEGQPFLNDHNIPSIIVAFDSFQAGYGPADNPPMKIFAASQCYPDFDLEFDKTRMIDAFLYRTFRYCSVVEVRVLFEVELEEPDNWHDFEKWARVLRKLRPLVKDKTVSIALEIFGTAERQTEDPYLSQSHLLQELGRWYNAFKLLRCKDVIFPPTRAMEFAQVATVMKSSEPVIDLLWSYSKLRRVVLEMEGPGWDREQMYQYMFPAQQAAERGDVQEYRRLSELIFAAMRRSLDAVLDTVNFDRPREEEADGAAEEGPDPPQGVSSGLSMGGVATYISNDF